MNDHHSHLTFDSFAIGGDEIPVGLTSHLMKLEVTYGGFPMLTTLMNELIENASSEVLKLHAGGAIAETSPDCTHHPYVKTKHDPLEKYPDRTKTIIAAAAVPV
jgi:2',3'-cyclic-nucleotide 2'-phosphodiesterase (5'-nucleotidase family)